jgi:hypothetical protein
MGLSIVIYTNTSKEAKQMKKSMVFILCLLVFCLGVFATFPVTPSLASTISFEDLEGGQLSPDNIPPPSEISSDPNYAEDFTSDATQLFGLAAADAISGSSSIKAISSSQVQISGKTTCSPTSSLSITLYLQVYYNGSWQSLASVYEADYGTVITASRTYNVTPGYYYRTSGIHRATGVPTEYTTTKSIYIG